MKQAYETAATSDLDKGWWWKLKTFRLFPVTIKELKPAE